MLTTLLITCLTSTCFSFTPRHYMNRTMMIPSSWDIIGKPQSNTIIEFGLLLPQNNIEQLEEELLIRSDPNTESYGKWLSKNEIDKLIFSNNHNFDAITYWISNITLSYTCIYTADSIYCRTSIENINILFDTEMLEYINSYTKTKFYSGRKMGYSIPLHLKNIIKLVIGVGDFIEYRNKPMKSKHLQYGTYYVTPTSVKELYNIRNYTHSYTSSQSVVEFQNDKCFNKNDLIYFLKDNDLDNITITKSHIIGECDMNTPDPDIEASLDIQYQVGINTNTFQEYISVPDWIYQFANTLYNLEDPPLVNSISYGWAEWDQCDTMVFPECYIIGDSEYYSRRTNIEFMKLALRGITILSASGDAGASGRTNEECNNYTKGKLLNPVFPASSPYIFSVGGTVITNPRKINSTTPFCKTHKCIGGGEEINCNFERCRWTSGGGFSNYFKRPWWQDYSATTYLNSKTIFPPEKYFNKFGRIYPDIAAVSHNFIIRTNGNYVSVDGTSASTPVISGMITILNNLRLSQNKPSVGLVAPLLYTIYAKCPDCFKDITEGSNNSTEATFCKYGYAAAKGFDAVYGLGTPNFDKIYEYVKNMNM